MYDTAEILALVPEVLAKMPRLVEVTVAPYTLADLARAMPYGALPVGGNSDYWQIDRDPDWTLPFGTWAYYDVTGCEFIADDEVPTL